MPGHVIDGNDFLAVYETAHAACEAARAGDGPSLLECKTYRLRGHSKSDRNLYRTKDEIESWRARDPIPRLRDTLVAACRMTEARAAAIEAEAGAEIEAAVEFARTSPDPDPHDLERDVYA
jgi:pyruvate dehydrogenase E1 component alpha subunit